jgi:hypothetical protein
VQKLLVLLGATAGSAAGWWLGAHVGPMSAFFVSLVGTVGGGYAMNRWLADYA